MAVCSLSEEEFGRLQVMLISWRHSCLCYMLFYFLQFFVK